MNDYSSAYKSSDMDSNLRRIIQNTKLMDDKD